MTDIIKGKHLFIKTLLIPFCVEYGQHGEKPYDCICSVIRLCYTECLMSTSLMQNILEIIETHLRSGKQVQCGMRGQSLYSTGTQKLLRD